MAIYTNTRVDPRVTELQELAREEGFKLPLSAKLIAWLEIRGCTVDLISGKATLPTREESETTVYAHTPSGKAVNYLLTPSECDAGASDYEEYLADLDWLRGGC